jgi:hypothetical protein
MTPEFLRALQAEILANPACQPFIHTNEMPKISGVEAMAKDRAIAEIISAGRTKTVSHFASERGVLERYPGGPLEADTLLGKLEAFAQTTHPMARIVGRALKFLAQPEGLDVGSPATQTLLGQLAAGGVITATERAGLQAMATVPDPVTAEQVGRAIRGPWGDEE